MQAQSPNPDYDFILKDQPKAKRGFSLPKGGARMPLIILGILIVAFVLVVILAAVLRPKAGGAQDLVSISARAQEIVRVSTIVEPLAQNSDTQGLVATTKAALGSDQAQLAAYLSKSGIKSNDKSLGAYFDKNAESLMQAAAQGGSLDTTYAGYLKKSLTAYKSALESTYPKASATAKDILGSAFESTETLLAAPQIRIASGS
jgi:NAD(P)-dependent dehydrogenase (short-subunit alcohol dehydrogenase family)